MSRDPIKTLEAMEKGLDKLVGGLLNDCAFKIKRRVDSDEFLHWKTRRRPIVVEKAKLVGSLMTANVRAASGWKWGSVFIGPPGSTTIKPKSGKSFLAIPTDFARRGVKSPKAYSGTQIFAGIIWGKAGWGGAHTGGGLRQHRAAGEKFKKQDLIPLFILKGSVVVRRRIIPADLLAWIKPQFATALQAKGLITQ